MNRASELFAPPLAPLKLIIVLCLLSLLNWNGCELFFLRCSYLFYYTFLLWQLAYLIYFSQSYLPWAHQAHQNSLQLTWCCLWRIHYSNAYIYNLSMCGHVYLSRRDPTIFVSSSQVGHLWSTCSNLKKGIKPTTFFCIVYLLG